MALLSCIEDLCIRTLSALPSVFEKLAYISRLRSDRRYFHWGLSRQFGEIAADEALSQTHTELWLDVLRTPTPALYRVFREYLAESKHTAESWYSQRKNLLPVLKGGGSESHFNAVALVLVELAMNDRDVSKAA